jgi:hypothetical protein
MERLLFSLKKRHAVFGAGEEYGRVCLRDRSECGGFRLLIRFAGQEGRLGQFAPVWLDQRRVAIDREMAALRVDDRGFAFRYGCIDNRPNDPIIAQALGVVGKDHDVGPRQIVLDRRCDSLFDLRRDLCPRFRVNPHHLVDPAHHPYLAGRRAMAVGDKVIRIHPRISPEEIEEHRSSLVLADHANHRDLGPQCRKVGADVCRAAQNRPLRLPEEYRHRRFRRQSLNRARQISIEHEVSDDHDAATVEIKVVHWPPDTRMPYFTN